ncbi:YcxB family protein [Streptomyces sp. NPDC059443]|uniref:YcxB family protein n=1 Tax=unclassified Streptomyces TaxID=2593676 RepID=UPI0036972B22
MDTNVHGDQAAPRTGQAVELVYQTTRPELAEALRARSATTAAGRRLRLMYPVLGTLLVLFGALSMAVDGAVGARPVGLAASGVVLWALAPFVPRLTPWLLARSFGRYMEKTGEHRVLVDDSGFRVTTAASEARIGWSAQPSYVETPGSFVMLSDDKSAVAITVLPKRGIVAPADADGLRAILDRNLRRL